LRISIAENYLCPERVCGWEKKIIYLLGIEEAYLRVLEYINPSDLPTPSFLPLLYSFLFTGPLTIEEGL
jgi:hypothetical protein